MHLRTRYVTVTAVFAVICGALEAQPLNQRVLVVYNSNSQASLDVANYYLTKRSIPAANLCAIAPPDASFLTVATYNATVRDPIRACLADPVKKSQTLYIVMSYMTPYAFASNLSTYAVDSALSDLWDQYTNQLFYPVPLALHDYYADSQAQGNVYQPYTSLATWRAQPGSKLLYAVWRLDGATQNVAQGLVDKALAAEAAGGPSGQGCFDTNFGDPTVTGAPDFGYTRGDWDLYRANGFFQRAGFTTILDGVGTEFGTPPSTTCPGAAFYSGWYALQHYNDAFTWNTGAIGFHLDSASAVNLRVEGSWSASALIRGITVTSGSVTEPYLEGLARPGGVYRNLLEGANVGDAFLRNTRWLKWMIMNMGDPLYTPFPGGHALFNPPPPEASLELSPMALIGGQNGNLVVSLAAAAPVGGTTVTLTNNSPSVATLPSSVLVTAGSRTATVPFTTSVVTDLNGVPVIIGANTASDKLLNTLGVYPMLGGLALSTSTIQGGQSLTGTVFLNDVAPPGGIAVSMSSSDPSASVAQFVTVPAGHSQANFPINTSVISADTSVTITATYAGASTPAGLTVLGTGGPPPVTTITTAPPGLALTLDSVACSAPCTFQWTPGSAHTIAVTTSPQSGGAGTQYVFANWSDGGAQSHTIVAPSSASTFTANFMTQYFLTTVAAPAAGGTIVPASNWYASGTVVGVSAAANSGYQFTGFTGALTGATTPQNVTMNGPASVTANFTSTAGQGWYNAAWTNRRKLTVDHTKVSGNPTNFPMLISTTDPELKSLSNGGKVGKTDGTDIVLTADDGITKLDHELESYNPATGGVVAWVRIPSLSSAADTLVYLYYGNSAATDQQNKTGVWDSNYRIVNHFKDASGPVFDSTQYANNGTPSGGATFTASGAMGGAYSFDGSNGSVTVPYNSSWNGSFNNYTAQMWIKLGAVQDYHAALAVGGYGGGFNIWFYSSGYGVLNLNTTNGPCQIGASVPLDNAFHQLVLAYDAGISRMTSYVDGVAAQYPSSCTGPIAIPAGNLITGGFNGGPYLQSTIDELRISANSTRNAAWIATEFANKSTGTFYGVGASETNGTPGVTTTLASLPSGLSLTVDASTTCTSPCAFQWTPGTNHTIAVTTSPQSGGAGTQYVFANWSDSGMQSHTVTAPASSATYTANFMTQYFLTTAAAPAVGGTILPASNWYASGTVVGVSASANSGYQFSGFSGALSGTTTPQNVTMNAPVSVAANFGTGTVAISITSAPAGLSLTVDGSNCTSPCPFQWTPGTNHTIAVTTSPQSGGVGTQYVFANWSDSGAQSHSITAPASSATYTANFTTQYFLTTAAAPAAGGTIAPASNWYASGTVVGVSATANNGYQFSGFSGALSGTTTPQNVTMNAAASVTANFTVSGGGSNWYNAAWTNRRKLTVDHTRVGGNLANFPMLVSITDPELKSLGNGGKVGKTDGTDIVFTAVDGLSKLDHELESYNAVTGSVVAWVRIPSLSNLADTSAYLYYGNSAATDQQNKTGVWDSNYRIVNHFKDASGPVFDSTQYANNGTPSGGATFTASGAMGGAYSFDGSNGSVTVPYNSSWNGSFNNYTAQMWIKPGALQDYHAALAVGGYGGGFNIWFYSSGYGVLNLNTTNGSCQIGASVPLDNAFHQLVLAYDAGISRLTSYVDGVAALYPSTCSGQIAIPAGNLIVGSFNGGLYLQSTIDELRISANSTRNAAWIATEFANKSTGTFYGVGASETNGTPGVTTTLASLPSGLSLTVDASTTCTSPCAFQWTPGTNHTIAVTTSPQSGGVGTQYVFANWSDSGAQSHSITAPASSATYTANFTTQYFLTTAAAPAAGGTIAPASNWYASGTVVGVSATANNGYQFSGFSGALSGTTTPQNVTMNAAASVTANFTVSGGGSNWYNAAWTNRRKLTVDHTRVGGNLANFPMLVSITDPELKSLGNGGKVGKTDGTDIVFTAVDGLSKLDHELESYNAVTGSVVAWVRIPSLSNLADTSAYLYYGNSAATDQQNKTGVWDSNYRIVNHFKDASGPVFDSTQYANNGTPSGGATFTASGAMGGAYSFDGSNGSVTVPYNSSWNGSFNNYTAQMWIKPGALQDYHAALAVGGYGGGFNIWFYSSGYGVLNLNTTNGSCQIGASVPLDNAFHQLVLAYDAGISRLTSYVDGVAALYPSTCSGQIAIPAGNLIVGSFNGGLYLQSTIDELRISANSTRNAAWIATEFANKSTGTFYGVGASETFH